LFDIHAVTPLYWIGESCESLEGEHSIDVANYPRQWGRN
jgi:hypothetical protein